MNKQFKVTVFGFIDEVFIGNDVEVEKYLKHIKSLQQSNISATDNKYYNKKMPLKFPISEYNFYAEKYQNPNSDMLNFREKYAKYGLKIKIESFENKNNFF